MLQQFGNGELFQNAIVSRNLSQKSIMFKLIMQNILMLGYLRAICNNIKIVMQVQLDLYINTQEVKLLMPEPIQNDFNLKINLLKSLQDLVM